ncbi:MAG: D-alanyl-D-alanine carboxypeptidase [Ruminococcaceae bacterium]|nr:D-alanyl-D-alanine carboxypeptidase [Oscillospiraceae bacterium]
MFMKKFVLIFFMAFTVLSAVCPVFAIDISARYACVMDMQTGRVLYEKNAYDCHSMASTTKIMTALLALENTKENEVVTVSKNAAGTEGSSIYLSAGEKLKMETLLYGLMLNSGNDAAIAIAEHVGGNVDTFAQMMTDRAHAIGAKNTQFKNPNGLDEEGHYTTAYDLALITRTALLNPRFAEIVATKHKSYPASEGSIARSFSNHNKLLSFYNGCIGVKTGFTKKTGRCLVSAAKRDHATVICVTLNAPNDWNDHKKLLDYGFSVNQSRPLVLKDMVLKTLPVKNGDTKALDLLAAEDFYLSYNGKEGLSKIELDYKLPATVPAPVTAGSQIGTLTIRYNGETLCQMDLLAGSDIEYQEPPKPTLWENFANFFINLLKF